MPYVDVEQKKEYDKRYYQKHKEELDEYHRQYNQRHKRRIVELSKQYRLKWRRKALNIVGDTCFFCGREEGEDRWKRLDIHRKDGKSHKQNVNNYKNILKNPEDWTPLCHRCHKGVHFCMDVLKKTWEEIVELFQKGGNYAY